MSDQQQGNEAAQETGRQFSIEKLYVKDISYEAPGVPQIFNETAESVVNLEISAQTIPLGHDHFEITLTVTVTVKAAEKTAYLVEVKQAGIFLIQGFGESDMAALSGSYCPNILFPYAREAVSDLVTRGGFPQLVLAPVNFDALFAQQQERARQHQGDAQSAVH